MVRNLLDIPGIADLLRDDFNGAAVNPALWSVTDTESKLSVANGLLSCAGGKVTPSHGDPGITGVRGYIRQAGLTVEGRAKSAAATTIGPYLILSNVSPLTGSGNRVHAMAMHSAGVLRVYETAVSLDQAVPCLYSAAAYRWLRIVIGSDNRAHYQVSRDGLTWYRLWVGAVVTTSPLYPASYSLNAACDADYLRVLRLSVPTPRLSGSPAAPTLVLGSELLTDGEMENWNSATDLTSWVENLSGTSTVNREDVVVRAGSHALRLNIDASNNYASIAQGNAVAGAWYRSTAWAKSDDADKPRFQMGGGSGAVINLQVTDVFAQYAATYWASSTSAFQFNRSVAPSKSIYLDDLSAKRITLSSMLTLLGDAGNCYGLTDRLVIVGADYSAGFVCCLDSATTPLYYLHAYLNRNDNKVYLLRVVNGTTTELLNGAITYTAGNVLRVVICPGSSGLTNAQVAVYYNNTQVGTTQTVDLSAYGTKVAGFATDEAASGAMEVWT